MGLILDIVLCPNPRRVQLTGGQTNTTTIAETTDPLLGAEEYRLDIAPERIGIRAGSPAGAFYARQTLKQMRRQFPQALPCLSIEDWPDFPVRGVMLDISRNKVPTLATLFDLIDTLAEWKINQLQLYIEHTFAYVGHETVWRDASPLTPAEIRQLDDYCRERFIELVPNQNSFGHFERWLKHPAYLPLAEVSDGAQTPWGFRWQGPFSLCPTDPHSLDLLRDLYAQLLPNFRSKLFNVGCDETFDIGQGRSKSVCAQRGVTRVYLDFLRQVNEIVRSHGRKMMFWGDIILHKPELISELPRDAMALNWGYEANHPFDSEGAALAQAGVPYYVCPGTSSWCSIAGRTDNCLANLRSAAENGLKHGAIGYLNTDWGDHGHLQYLPVSYLGFLAGAAYSWCLESNGALDIVRALDRHAFHCTRGSPGRIAFDLGNVYQACGKLVGNASTLFRLIVPPQNGQELDGLQSGNLFDSIRAINRAMQGIESVRMDRADAPLILDEFRNAARTLHWACFNGLRRMGVSKIDTIDISQIISEHERLWLARNRVGGLVDSVRRLKGS